MAHLRP
jgi:putative addiction module component (TIGR02574 family)